MLALAMTIVAFAFIFTIAWKYIYKKWFINSRYYLMWKKIDKHENILRIITIIFCLTCIGLYIGLRWVPGLQNIIKYGLLTTHTSPTEFRSANISIVFMLDLCSMLGILIPLLKIFDNKKKVLLKPLAYLACLGGYATLFFTVTESYLTIPGTNGTVAQPWDAYYFFFSAKGSEIGNGSSDEPLMFLMHYWMVLIGLHTIVWESKVNWKEFLIILTFIVLYAIYIYSMSSSLQLYTHVTAMVKGDFEPMTSGQAPIIPDYYTFVYNGVNLNKYPGHPSYKVFVDIYGCTTWEAASAVTWVTFAVIVCIEIFIKNFVSYFTEHDLIVVDTLKNNKGFIL